MSSQYSTGDGGPVFPQLGWEKTGAAGTALTHKGGMSLRDYFAAQALIGVINRSRTGNEELMARDAYRMADFMLLERTRAGISS